MYSAASEQDPSLKAVHYYNFFASRITSLDLLRSVLLLTEYLLLVGDDSTIFQVVLVEVTLKSSSHILKQQYLTYSTYKLLRREVPSF